MAAPATDSPTPRLPGRRRLVPLVIALLAIHFALAVGSKFHESTTSDEIGHLAGGMVAWQTGDYRLHPETGILPQLWAALPWKLSGARLPNLGGNEAWNRADAGVVDHQLFYESGADHFPWLMAGRAMIALFSVGTGLLAFFWSRRVFGDAGGVVSLILFSFCPTFLANGALVTSDACMAFFFLAAVGAWWLHLHDGRARFWALSSVVFGLAFTAKYSALLLIPMAATMAVIRAFAPAPLELLGRVHATRGRKIAAMALSSLGHGLVAMAAIWIFFGFRYSIFSAEPPLFPQFEAAIGDLETRLGLAGMLTHAARTIHLLPEAYLHGFSFMLETVKSRNAYLNGDYSTTGWPSFFLWTFILKSTVPLLLACALTAVLAVRRWRTGGAARFRADCYRLAPLLVLVAIYGGASIAGRLDIGHRHILPIYPALFIGAGALGSLVRFPSRAPSVLLAALLGWHAVSAIRVAPDFIAYFNELAGGPGNGLHFLVDSSLDWGQDLPGLRDWIDGHAAGEPVYLSYFGGGEPAYYGIEARRLPFLNNFKRLPSLEKLEPGVYCISATILADVYGPSPGTWTLDLEKEYQKLRTLEPVFLSYTRDAAARARLEGDAPAAQWQASLRRYDELRLARLCHYLRARSPDASVGYSIEIYRLTAAEIAGATSGPMSDLMALIEKARAGQK